MNYLDACAGLGGFALGLQMAGLRFDWHGYSEIDRNCEDVYARHYPEAIQPGDLARWSEWGIAPGWLDIFSCGFPCPPFSVAGKRLGGDDPHNLWPIVAGAIRGLRPRIVMLENVPGILTGDGEQPAYFGRVLGDLAEAGYDAEWEVLSAKEAGASHRRERVFVVGDAAPDGQPRGGRTWAGRKGFADASLPLFPPGPNDAEGWRRVLARWPELAPAIGGRLNVRFVEWLMGYPIGWTDGMKRSAALKALGNAVVPLCVAEALSGGAADAGGLPDVQRRR